MGAHDSIDSGSIRNGPPVLSGMTGSPVSTSSKHKILPLGRIEELWMTNILYSLWSSFYSQWIWLFRGAFCIKFRRKDRLYVDIVLPGSGYLMFILSLSWPDFQQNQLLQAIILSSKAVLCNRWVSESLQRSARTCIGWPRSFIRFSLWAEQKESKDCADY